MRKKEELKNKLGFVPNLDKETIGEKLSKIPDDMVLYVFDDTELEKIKIDHNLEVNIDILYTVMAGSSDFVVRDFN